MRETAHKAIAIVGVGAVMPDAPDVSTFWSNLRNGRYSITETPADRWNSDAYWDPDPKVPDKTYSKIGGWVRDWTWDPIGWKLPIPPRVSENMDRTQKWAILAAREALADAGWPERPFDAERTAVILGNAMAGERHYLTALRLSFPEYARELEASPSFAALPPELRDEIAREFHAGITHHLPGVNEDTMPGELSNIIAGRIANVFNFHGPNYVVDAACASAMAAIGAAIEGLEEEDYDVVLTGGVDANMSAHTFIKFCKIGALSATGTRPYADGADGFVMGEGSAVFVLKRLADAERDGDKVYAVIRGIGGSSDGRGKGITAPNPAGQKLAVARAWENAGLPPGSVNLLEGHGTSTRVGDVAEVESLNAVFGQCGLPTGAIPLGSVKSNIGHLKGAAGAAGILKVALALRDKVLPPSLSCERPNPNIDFAHLPFRVHRELAPWDVPAGVVRRAGVSAFGFGGTNFHAVLEEHVPGSLSGNGGPGRKTIAVGTPRKENGPQAVRATATPRIPPRGIFLAGAATPAELAEKLRAARDAARAGQAPPPAPPRQADLTAPLRLAIDHGDAAELAAKAEKALQALDGDHAGMWRALRAQGIFRGAGTSTAKVAFLYTGQGSQYLGMLANLRHSEPVINETFAEADRVMTPILGRPLTSFLYVDESDPEVLQKAEQELRQTAITQPAVLAVDIALTRVLAEHGIAPDLVMGHSLGEYGALVAAGSLSFAEALEAVAARGREMTKVSVADKGRMIAVMAPLHEIEQVLAALDGYAVVANINSTAQAVVGGSTDAVTRAEKIFQQAGREVRPLPVSHAFHTSIVAQASEPLKEMLARLDLRPPQIPIVANATGQLYPMGPDVVPQMIDLLGRQIAAPVQFVQGLRTLYDQGVRVFVEVGPKRALHGFTEDVLGKLDDVLALATNHPKAGDVVSLNHALCGLYASGRGNGSERGHESPHLTVETARSDGSDRSVRSDRSTASPLVVTGGALGLPGPWKVFDDANVGRLLHGEQAIDVVSLRFRRAMVDKHITRLVKSEEGGGPRFETIESAAEVIKLAARCGELDLGRDFGIPQERLAAWDHTTQLAVGAGLEALRDAGIPLVLRYKTATTGARLPDRWGLPDALRDETGVIFASAFPGYDSLLEIVEKHHADKTRRERLADLQALKARSAAGDPLRVEIDRRIHEIEVELAHDPYQFDRRFLFRVLSMGHAQFAELIGARGPNTQINAACASTTQAFSLAEDWIRAGRCRRVVVVAADDITTDRMLGWWGAGFLASGAAATDELVEDAALPFDRRRHGMIIGMGAAAVVIESPEAARERGLRPICELLSAQTANSAFHGTRLDVRHIGEVMERLVGEAEARWGIDRREIAPQTVFVSHETYTPARGGSAQAEVDALRKVFGAQANQVVVANTKGYTGHPMAVGIEDVMAVKSLETGLVPPVPNLREPDPDLGGLNLSAGGAYPVRYALRLGAGFGSQIGMTLLRQVPNPDGVRRTPDALGYAYRIADPAVWKSWLARVSGDPQAEVEVVHRTLRVVDRATARKAEAPRVPAPAPAPVVPIPEPAPVPVVAAPVQAPAPVAAAAVVPSPPGPLSHPHSHPPGEGEKDLVQEKVLALIAEKTGYPQEMLALDLDLEADLGIDTVKQAEVFAAIRQEYGIPRDENLKLRDFPTLSHTIGFVYDRRPDLKAPAPAPVVAAAVVPSPPDPLSHPHSHPPGEGEKDPVQEKVLALIADKTGYPQEMLDLDLDLEADLGIDTVKQAEVFAAIRQEYGIPRDENLKLRDFPTLNHTIGFVYDRRPDLKAPAPAPVVAATVVPSPPDPLSHPHSHPPGEGEKDQVQEKVLALIADKTGYPQEMLDLDLDLEADLGIDTVKQAEVFAAIRQEYGIPRDENLKLRDFPTLSHTIGFVYDRRPDLKPAGHGGESRRDGMIEPGVGTPGDLAAAADKAETAETLPTAPTVAIPRRVPVPVLRPSLDLCKPTGVTLEAGGRVLVAFDQGGVGKALAGRLAKLGVEVLALEDYAETDAVVALLQAWRDEGPVQGVYWLPALDREPEIGALDVDAWREALRRRVKLLSHTLRTLYDDLDRPGSFVIAGTRLGGRHGYDEAGALAPMGGGVSGLAKAIQRERPGALVKVVDFAAGRQTAALADQLIDETLRDPGAVEIGWENGRRWTVGLSEEPPAAGPGLALTPQSVFVVTGAAGSIVSAILQDLTAAAHGGAFHLLDLAAAPDPADPDLLRFHTDRDGLKRDLFERIKARGERATPALVEKELARLERGRAALDALESIRAAGGTAVWHQLDLRDGAAVHRAVDRVRAEHGRVDLLLHAGGLEISRKLTDKKPEEYDLVFDVKADGWFHLLSALGDLPLGAAVVFSSIAGRFGNDGQTDYSAANDLLCKQVSAFRHSRPGTLGIALDWTAWGGIGMATRGSIPQIMEAAGIDMLPPETGIPWTRRELTAGTRGEVVVAGRLGVMLQERDATGGLDVSPETLDRLRAGGRGGVMVGRAVRMGVWSGLEIETTLDPAEQPFLDHHRIDGTPVLPGVMGVEAFAQAASFLFPDLTVHGVENVEFLAPFKFYRDAPRTMTIRLQLRPDGDGLVALCTLLGSRTLPNQSEPQVTEHFRARVRLTAGPTAEPPGEPAVAAPRPVPAAGAVGAGDVYKVYFHGPAYQVVGEAWKDGDRIAGRLADGLPPNHQPAALPTLMEPRLIELCFQTAGIGELGTHGRMALPLRVDSVRTLRRPNGEALYAVTHPQNAAGGVDAWVVDGQGNVYLALSGYRTIELPGGMTPEVLRPFQTAMA